MIPILAEGYYGLRAAYAKWAVPEDFFLVHMKKGELRGPGFAKSVPRGGSWELTGTGLRDLPGRPASPTRRGRLGEILVLAPRGSVLGQAAKEMVEGCSIALASRKRPPGNRQPKRRSGGRCGGTLVGPRAGCKDPSSSEEGTQWLGRSGGRKARNSRDLLLTLNGENKFGTWQILEGICRNPSELLGNNNSGGK